MSVLKGSQKKTKETIWNVLEAALRNQTPTRILGDTILLCLLWSGLQPTITTATAGNNSDRKIDKD